MRRDQWDSKTAQMGIVQSDDEVLVMFMRDIAGVMRKSSNVADATTFDRVARALEEQRALPAANLAEAKEIADRLDREALDMYAAILRESARRVEERQHARPPESAQ